MTHRITRSRLAWLASQLSDHAHTVTRILSDQRFATTRQLARFLRPAFQSDASALRQTNRLMGTLQENALVKTLQRRVGGARAGSSSYVWHLSEAGYRLDELCSLQDSAATRPVSRRRITEPSWTFLAHTLAVTELRLVSEETCRMCEIELVKAEPEPTCWAKHLGPYGQPEWVKPDLGLVTACAGYEYNWWCELDMGTERPIRINRKTDAYLRHLTSGIEQRRRGVFPVVVWVTSTLQRAEQLISIFSARTDLPAGMFQVATLEDWPRLLANTASAA